MKLVFIRHGEPDYTRDSLTEKGMREAAYLGERVKEWKVDGLPVTPYLVPQDCGVHMDTDWLQVRRSSVLANELKGQGGKTEEFSLRFEKLDSPFAFSCLPYTALELESAAHQEELPPARRTVACILGAVRGVGGIDSWGSDVERPWHIDGEQDIAYSFAIVPVWE